jgi:hypothetical protein
MLLTLTSWLRHMGNRQLVAEDLHVHPQTVRYRMAQLRELFGPALRDPSQRAALQLALAWGPPRYDPAEPRAHARGPEAVPDRARINRAGVSRRSLASGR